MWPECVPHVGTHWSAGGLGLIKVECCRVVVGPLRGGAWLLQGNEAAEGTALTRAQCRSLGGSES